MKALDYKSVPLFVLLLLDHGASYTEDARNIYWFEKNLQGDVVAVYDQAGNKLIAYTYDAWGNTTINYYNSGDSTVTAGKGMDASKLRDVYKHSKDTLKTAVSPTKIARYSSKMSNVKTTVAKEIGHAFRDGIVSIGFEFAFNKIGTVFGVKR